MSIWVVLFADGGFEGLRKLTLEEQLVFPRIIFRSTASSRKLLLQDDPDEQIELCWIRVKVYNILF
jgi:hypothetical protein